MKAIYLFVAVFLAQPLAAQTLSVVHEKTLRFDGRGKIEITDSGIAYKAEKDDESRTWAWRDIQHFDRIGEREFSILGYDDEKLLLGRDRRYRFRITAGRLTDELFAFIEKHMGAPVTDRVVGKMEDPEYSVPVKHLHTFGGCEGMLEFTKDAIYYRTDDKKDARVWRLDRDLQSIWSADPYRLEIYVYENNQFGKTRIFRFELKKPLDEAYYRKLKLKLYDLGR